MKIKEKKELFAKTIPELKNLLKEKRNEHFLLKQELAQKKLKNTKSVFWKKKEIARILTIIREKDLSAEQAGLFEDAKNI